MSIYDPIAIALDMKAIEFIFEHPKDPIQAKLHSLNRPGYTLSEETKAKMRKPKSEEHRKNISKSQKGVSVPSRGNAKGAKRPGVGGVKKGTIPWNAGKKHSPETKEKIRQAALRRLQYS